VRPALTFYRQLLLSREEGSSPSQQMHGVFRHAARGALGRRHSGCRDKMRQQRLMTDNQGVFCEENLPQK